MNKPLQARGTKTFLGKKPSVWTLAPFKWPFFSSSGHPSEIMPGDTRIQPYPQAAARKALKKKLAAEAINPPLPEGATVIAQFKSPEGETCGPPLNLPANVNPEQLALLLNNLLQNVCVIVSVTQQQSSVLYVCITKRDYSRKTQCHMLFQLTRPKLSTTCVLILSKG